MMHALFDLSGLGEDAQRTGLGSGASLSRPVEPTTPTAGVELPGAVRPEKRTPMLRAAVDEEEWAEDEGIDDEEWSEEDSDGDDWDEDDWDEEEWEEYEEELEEEDERPGRRRDDDW